MKWPALHEQVLARVWPEMGEACAPMFPEYTKQSIRAKARRMGLEAPPADDEADEPLVTDACDKRARRCSFGFIPGGPVATVFNLASAIGGKP